MAPGESQDIETATTNVQAQPDNKTRRYDRQLRLWAATGQAALESSRILVLSASATSTSILKNLVLPGIGHFTILDHQTVTPEDAGNNFFLEGHDSVGKSRAEEAVRLLGELNDGVEGEANTADFEELLKKDPDYFTSFSLIIAHNIRRDLLEDLSKLLWSSQAHPSLIVVRTAGFLTEFYIQYHEHDVIESHSETTPSLRIDKPFPALLEHATSIDFDNMDPTEHGHIPYVIILVHAMDKWKKVHDGKPPQTYEEKKAFKQSILAMKVKSDEENFDEAEAQAYRAWTSTGVPSEIQSILTSPKLNLDNLTPSSPIFYHLLSALKQFAAQPPHVLPLSSTLPDMKSDTENYVHLQRLYKARAEHERGVLRGLVQIPVEDELVDVFVKNAHGLRVLHGRRWGEFDSDREAIANALSTYPKETVTHLAFYALDTLKALHPDAPPTAAMLQEQIKDIVGPQVSLPEDELGNALGELARTPTADVPNTAAFVGGLVAQEAIKMITKQYVPINGYCVADLVDSWTGVVGP
ncbi:uncharacterized protein STEHIDRAFT_123436 [Stereum hirsutum FP-91666 SS1]|uniref:uncharacterized protein n=1 Tax=Stereum hirsutum (strain FP-91666) TaxID=721885 RepID=UPI0004449A19|nr:uncharacterized protein STEHIDRAFT_123436 [Stereum hirsutum FP-91666 SS1]EIM83859.1 hypothetical protein STEHIDRAFT_123436 [Stereum hirsutum FP-91666 SS1]